MTTREDLNDLANQNLKSADILISAGDWLCAAYMLGYVLEFTLKACACKSLNHNYYPDTGYSDRVHSYFKTHVYDQLLMISGIVDLVGPDSKNLEVKQNWDDFTGMYLGEWTNMRYNKDKAKEFTEEKVFKLRNQLMSEENGVIVCIRKEGRC